MDKYIDVVFPADVTRADAFSGKLNIIGPSYLNITSIYDKTIITFKNSSALYSFTSNTISTSGNNILNVGLINNIKTKIINDSIKLFLKGLLLTGDNGFCINEFLILKIPNTNDPDIVYQHIIPLWKYQGVFGCNYMYRDNVLTIVALFFTAVHNAFFPLKTSSVTLIST